MTKTNILYWADKSLTFLAIVVVCGLVGALPVAAWRIAVAIEVANEEGMRMQQTQCCLWLREIEATERIADAMERIAGPGTNDVVRQWDSEGRRTR